MRRKTPDKPAIVFGNSLLSYAQVADRTGRLCGLLRSMGCAKATASWSHWTTASKFTLTMLAAELAHGWRHHQHAGCRDAAAARRDWRRFVTPATVLATARQRLGRDGRLSLLVTGAPVAGCRHFSELDQSESSYRLAAMAPTRNRLPC